MTVDNIYHCQPKHAHLMQHITNILTLSSTSFHPLFTSAYTSSIADPSFNDPLVDPKSPQKLSPSLRVHTTISYNDISLNHPRLRFQPLRTGLSLMLFFKYPIRTPTTPSRSPLSHTHPYHHRLPGSLTLRSHRPNARKRHVPPIPPMSDPHQQTHLNRWNRSA